MLRTTSRFRRLAFAAASFVAVASVACGGTEPIVQPNVDITGNYVATYFHVTPTGKPTIDVLAKGGSLTMAIAANKATSGTLVIPQDVFGSSVTANMAGLAHQSGHTVLFEQSAATFVGQLPWLAGGGTIATDVNDGSSRVEVILTRQ